MITRIEIFTYRCFRALSVPTKGYQVLAGANGAGKTTLLDVPALLGDLVRGQRVTDAFLHRLDHHPPRAASLTELTFGGRGDQFGFAVEARLPGDIAAELAGSTQATTSRPAPTHLRYELALDIFNDELAVSGEYLFLFSEDGRRPEPGLPLQGAAASPRGPWWPVITREGRGAPTRFRVETTSRGPRLPDLRVPDRQLALGAVLADDKLFPAALWLAGLLGEGVVFFDPDWAALRQAAPPGDPPRLLPSARNTPWLARLLAEEDARRDSTRFASWVDHVRTALPQVEQIEVRVREDDRHAYFAVRYTGGYEVTSSGLSDGTLRILALTLLPYLPESAVPRLLITEEPENGIHPRAIETVVQSLSELYDSQVWVSTHSPIVLAHTDLDDVLAARIDADGEVEVIPGRQHPQLVDWRGSVDLGTLFAAGVLS